MTDNNVFNGMSEENDDITERDNVEKTIYDIESTHENTQASKEAHIEHEATRFEPENDRGVGENENSCTYHTSPAQNAESVYAFRQTNTDGGAQCGAYAPHTQAHNADMSHTQAQYTQAPRSEVYISRNAEQRDANSGTASAKKTKKQRGLGTIAIVAAACVVLSGFAAFGGTYLAGRALNVPVERSVSVIYKSTNEQGDNGGISNTDSNFGKLGTYSDVAAKVASSVVEIRTETVSTSSIFSQYITEGAGSGVVITSDGYIITNNHVIEGASTVTVSMNDGTAYPAEVIGSDAESDLAVLKIDATDLTPAVVGDSSKLVVGEEVIAIGNPLGSLGGTVTNGIISALARQVTIDGTEMTLLQTNAAVNPGNSGGGLFNLAGELVGIVNAKSSGSGIEGLGFAIPSSIASQVVEQLINYGYVRGRVSLGISYMDISDSYTAMMYRVNTLGVYILESEYNDELKIGDRVTAVDGTEVTYGSDIKAILKDHKVGDKITLTVVRDGKYVDVEMECHEYIPGKTDEDEDKTAEKSNSSIFNSPFSSWFGY